MEAKIISSFLEEDFFKTHDAEQECSNRSQGLDQDKEPIGDNTLNQIILAPGDLLQGTPFKAPNLERLVKSRATDQIIESFNAYNGSHPSLPNICLTSQDATRWRMVLSVLKIGNLGRTTTLQIDFGNQITPRCKDWPNVKRLINDLSIGIGFSTAALIYGGLHALAWFAHFSSSTEQLLWRVSACVVMAGIPVFFASVNIDKYIEQHSQPPVDGWITFFTLDFKPSLLSRISGALHYLLAVIVLLAYILARAYLVVECFINLSHLPAGVYKVPKWASYFPHIS